jgi:preprotein translocase subunit SecD
VAVIAIYLDLPSNPGIPFINRDVKAVEGLDLQGGMQVMLEANMPDGQPVSSDAMEAAKGIIENRINGLGVSEPLIQRQGENRIIVELPGIKDPDLAIKTFGQTGLLEFVDTGSTYVPEGTLVNTSNFNIAIGQASANSATASGDSAAASAAATPAAASGTTPTYKTIMTGSMLRSAEVVFNPNTNQPEISFTLTDEGGKVFGTHTAANVYKYMAIVMDGKVVSCPRINSAIPDGKGVIEGKFTVEEAKSLVLQLKYGSLPVPLKVVENNTVGPTLGQDSVNKSLIAGAIGIGLVMIFMIVLYGIPGLLADVALLIYTAAVFALFKLIPITLTVPGIAGFILSIGMAVDANILIFERTREELRAGKTVGSAVEAGFGRAWTSIRDSNISTLITCIILFWFGSNFGASIIKGFSLTLGLGVIVSLFTAITVTRTFLRLVMNSTFGRTAHLFRNIDQSA